MGRDAARALNGRDTEHARSAAGAENRGGRGDIGGRFVDGLEERPSATAGVMSTPRLASIYSILVKIAPQLACGVSFLMLSDQTRE